MGDNGKGSKRRRVLQMDDVLLYEGGKIAWERRSKITRVRIGPQVREIPHDTFACCIKLAEVHFDEGLEIIGKKAFSGCTALQQVVIPSSVTKLGDGAFLKCINLTVVQFDEGSALKVVGQNAFGGCDALRSVNILSSVTSLGFRAFYNCINLARVQLNDGLQDIGSQAFFGCTALQSVTVPSSITKLGYGAFTNCTNLTEVILLGGKRLLNQGFLECGRFSGQGVLNQKRLNELIYSSPSVFHGCPLAAIKISIPRELSERMTRLPQDCRPSVEGRIRELSRLELTQDGFILACFPIVTRAPEDEFDQDTIYVQDTDNQTAESLHQVLRFISFHELKESSILIELAMWKSRLVEDRARADCRTSVPDPVKILIMEYCGFTDFLEPAIEGG